MNPYIFRKKRGRAQVKVFVVALASKRSLPKTAAQRENASWRHTRRSYRPRGSRISGLLKETVSMEVSTTIALALPLRVAKTQGLLLQSTRS